MGVVPVRTPVNDDIELNSAVAELGRAAHSSIAVMPDSFMVARTDHVNSLATQYHLPLISPYCSYTERRGLVSYGPDIADNYRRAANYVDRILKSDAPGELPVHARVTSNSSSTPKPRKHSVSTSRRSLLTTADDLIE